jgi:predicted DNA-binding ribbon-helix-helix protein
MPRTKIAHSWNYHITFRSDHVMVDQLEKIAAREGITKAALLRDIVDKGIKTRNSAVYRDRLFDDQ